MLVLCKVYCIQYVRSPTKFLQGCNHSQCCSNSNICLWNIHEVVTCIFTQFTNIHDHRVRWSGKQIQKTVFGKKPDYRGL